MNQTEQRAYNWLLAQDITEKEIIYQRKKTPDFVTASGQGFEIKRLYGNMIWFHKEQFMQLKSIMNVTVLVFDNEHDIPIAKIPADQLKENAIIDGIKITVVDSSDGNASIRISVLNYQRILVLAATIQEKEKKPIRPNDVLDYLFEKLDQSSS